MSISTELAEALNGAFKPFKFRRRGKNWYRVTDDLYSIVNIQKSPWGEEYYVNIGFSPSGHARNSWIAVSKCWVRFRVESILSFSFDDIRLLDAQFDGTIGGDLRENIAEKIVAPVVQVVEVARTLRDLSEILTSKVSRSYFIHKDMRKILGLEGAVE